MYRVHKCTVTRSRCETLDAIRWNYVEDKSNQIRKKMWSGFRRCTPWLQKSHFGEGHVQDKKLVLVPTICMQWKLANDFIWSFVSFTLVLIAFQGIWIIVTRDNLSALKNVSSHNEKMDESVNKVTGSRKNSLIESTLQNSKANKKASWRLHKSMRRTWKVLLHVVKDAQYCSSLFLVVECMVVFAVVFAAACS